MSIIQGDHLSGKPGNVREVGTCQGNVRNVVNSQGNVREKILSLSGKYQGISECLESGHPDN